MIVPSVACIWGILELFFLFNFATSQDIFGSRSYDAPAVFGDPPIDYTYSRLPEIEKGCSHFLSLASELKPDDGRGYRIKKELSFFQGEWVQEPGRSPLVPFDDSDLPRESSSSSSPFRLVEFEVKDVSPVHLLKNAVSLYGSMLIAMARNSVLLHDSRSTFHMSPGMSVLKLVFEGVYIESEKNGGQRLLCMLGNTTRPFSNSNSVDDPSDKSSNFDSFSNSQFRLLQDGGLLLLLHYPKILSLTKRAILGELRSLNEPGKPRYFDVVHVTSQLSRFSRYQFSSEKLKSKTCDYSSYRDELEEDGANTFNDSEICNVLHQFSIEHFSISPNWRSSGRVVFQSFFPGQEIKTIDRSYQDFKLIMQNIICEQETGTEIMSNSTRVAAVLRAIPAEMDRDTAATMSGLSDMTLSVEGAWDSSKGQLCMVGCPGVVNSGLEECDSQISLYFPRSFSIKQRSVIFGSISSSSSKTNSYDPILLELGMRPDDLRYNHGQYSRSHLLYNYSKIELARAYRKRDQLPEFVRAIKPLLLSYPGRRSLISRSLSNVKRIVLKYSALHQHDDDLSSLSYDLSFPCYGFPLPSYQDHTAETFMELEVLSMGPLISGHDPRLLYDPVKYQVKMSKSGLLNISLSLMFTEGPLKFREINYKNISKLFLEGLYDSVTGQMHLIGCRKIPVPSMNLNLERGFDCLIEVKIAYPAETIRWLINPRAVITISSQRSKDDNLFFKTIKLETSMLRYNSHELDAVFRKFFEEILRNLMVLASIALISSQLLYVKENVDGIPYISRIMLSFQSVGPVGYVFPLISNAKILLQEKEYQSPRNLYGYEHILTLLDYTGKLLGLAAFLLTVTLSRKVAESRKKPHLHLPSHSNGVPDEKKIRFAFAIVLVLGLLVHYHHYGEIFQSMDANAIGAAQLEKIWKFKLQEFIGFIQDLFLLPQIIENMKWETNFRPLRKLYYIGFTLMRLVLHLYDYVRDPSMDPYSGEVPSMNPDMFFTARAPNLAIVVIMTVLAIVLYSQQKESQQKLIQQQRTVSAKSR